jgi:hypothetical protein
VRQRIMFHFELNLWQYFMAYKRANLQLCRIRYRMDRQTDRQTQGFIMYVYNDYISRVRTVVTKSKLFVIFVLLRDFLNLEML